MSQKEVAPSDTDTNVSVCGVSLSDASSYDCLKPEYSIHKMNKILTQKPTGCNITWYEDFVSQFFEDDAEIIAELPTRGRMFSYRICRRFIPGFFESLYKGNVVLVNFHLPNLTEGSSGHQQVVYGFDSTVIIHYSEPFLTPVVVSGNLIYRFDKGEPYKIKLWTWQVTSYVEFVPRYSVMYGMHMNPSVLLTNITAQGIPNTTVKFLQFVQILQSMYPLMVNYKGGGVTPRQSLQMTLRKRKSF